MSEVKFTSNDVLEQVSERAEELPVEIERLRPFGLSEEATCKMALKNLREDGASRNTRPATVNKIVALMQLIPALRGESKERLIAFARREVRLRRRLRALRKREFKQWYSAFCRADKTIGGVTGSRSTNPEGYARRDALISDIITRRPTVSRPASHTPRSARHTARSATSTSPGSSDDGSSDGPSDDPASPVTPLVCDLDKRRNSSHSELSHKQENNINIDLLDRLQFGSAALLFSALASLAARWSR